MKKLKSINNIPFLVCLGLLVLNDFYLKAEYHNWLTGKLSDFCGLFVFASFWTAIIPGKKRTIYFSTALLFVIWKSPYSQSFIDFFSYNFFTIDRVVDVTDLLALVILPISYFYHLENANGLRFSPLPVAFLTFVSFCATSIPAPTQTFEQPQYLLFKSEYLNLKNSKYWNDYNLYKLDSLVIIEIKELRIAKRAFLDDEFHKTQILKDLDLRLLRGLNEGYPIRNKLSEYIELKDSLVIKGRTSIALPFESYIDSINFAYARLDGSFKRLSRNNKLLIDGKFKNGVEDSIWTFYNNAGEISSKKHFRNGELIKKDIFDSSKLISEERYNTRNEIINRKYFHLAIILLFIIALLSKLVFGFRKSARNVPPTLPHFTKIVGALGLPLVVLFMAKMISSSIPNSASIFFISLIIEIAFAYIVLVLMFLVVFYLLKLKTKSDIIFYITVFALILVFLEECFYLGKIIGEMSTIAM